MSMTNNRTGELWHGMMQRINEIETKIDSLKYSLKVYPIDYFSAFNAQKQYTKMALVEVQNFDNIPEGMIAFELQEGEYAVFKYIGSSHDNSIFQTIFTKWLPSSEYQLDPRPHFEVLGEKYKNNDPNSEEEIWIPVTNKTKKSLVS